MIYLKLFLSFLQVGMFSIGGGYAAIPLIREQSVVQNAWLTMSEFTDLVTIAEMTPGPIALNAATFVGIRVAGFAGALIATFGSILPSCVIASLLAYIYFRYKGVSVLDHVLAALRPAVVSLIASAGLSILLQVLFGTEIALQNFDPFALLLFAGAFFALRRFKCSGVPVMLCCGAANLLCGLIRGAL